MEPQAATTFDIFRIDLTDGHSDRIRQGFDQESAVRWATRINNMYTRNETESYRMIVWPAKSPA